MRRRRAQGVAVARERARLDLKLGRRTDGRAAGATGRDFERVSEALWSAAAGLWQSLLGLLGMGEPQWSRVGLVVTDVILPYFVGGLLPAAP